MAPSTSRPHHRWSPSTVAARCSLLAACSFLLAACGSESDSTSAESADAGLQVIVKPVRAAPGGTVRAAVVNGSDEEFTYGAAYELERQMGEDFEPVKLPRTPVPQIGYVAKPGETGAPVEVKVPATALPGQYRVVIQRGVPDVGDLSGEFEVRDGG